MRLSQFARKHNIAIQEIVNLVKDHSPADEAIRANTLLSESDRELIAKYFDIEEEPEEAVSETENEPAEDLMTSEGETEEKVDSPEEIVPEIAEQVDIFDHQEDLDEPDEEIEPEETSQVVEDSSSPTEMQEIRTDEFLDLLESEEPDVDLSKITKIKAPTKKLEGIKVLGKIELPEPSPKKESNSQEKKDEKPKYERKSRRALNHEDREKKRLEAKRQREAEQRKKEKRKREKERDRIKSQKRAHYEQKIRKLKDVDGKKRKTKSTDETMQSHPVEQPKTLLGKFWKWFTSY